MNNDPSDSEFATRLALIWPELKQRLHGEIIRCAAQDTDFVKAGAIVLAGDSLLTAMEKMQSAEHVETKQFTRPALHPHNQTEDERYASPTSL